MSDETRPPAPLRRPDYAPSSDFWEGRYRTRDTVWDVGEAAPPLVEYFRSAAAPRPPARVIVPGSGRGHEALFLATLGFEVTAVDFAPSALAALRRRRAALGLAADRCRTLRGDVLELPPKFLGAFDIWVEHTCFCAIDPSARDAYVASAHRTLRTGGRLVGLFYPFRVDTPGPPFPVDEGEVRAHFAPAFDIESWTTPASSVERRRGEERLIVMRRR